MEENGHFFLIQHFTDLFNVLLLLSFIRKFLFILSAFDYRDSYHDKLQQTPFGFVVNYDNAVIF